MFKQNTSKLTIIFWGNMLHGSYYRQSSNHLKISLLISSRSICRCLCLRGFDAILWSTLIRIHLRLRECARLCITVRGRCIYPCIRYLYMLCTPIYEGHTQIRCRATTQNPNYYVWHYMAAPNRFFEIKFKIYFLHSIIIVVFKIQFLLQSKQELRNKESKFKGKKDNFHSDF
jgi:hypothetical protein